MPANPSNKFKYTSLEFNISLDLMNWSRSTYSLLDWLGDLGGLFESLSYICAVFIQPSTVFTLRTSLLTSLFRFKEKSEPDLDASDSKKMADEI